jgi:hypothetical protein
MPVINRLQRQSLRQRIQAQHVKQLLSQHRPSHVSQSGQSLIPSQFVRTAPVCVTSDFKEVGQLRSVIQRVRP